MTRELPRSFGKLYRAYHARIEREEASASLKWKSEDPLVEHCKVKLKGEKNWYAVPSNLH